MVWPTSSPLRNNPDSFLQKSAGFRACAQLIKRDFDKLVDGGASSPARCRVSNLRFEPSAVSPSAKPENPLGFQPSCHPYQFLLKSFRFPGAKTARKRFLLWKMRFSSAKIVPRPPYTPPGTIKSSRELRPARALQGFFDSLCRRPHGRRLSVSNKPPIYVVIPNQWCSAQRIKIVMIASGNHTVIYRRLVWQSPRFSNNYVRKSGVLLLSGRLPHQ